MSEQEGQTAPPGWARRLVPWLSLALTVVLVIAGVWYLSARVGLGTILAVLGSANIGYVALALVVMIGTLALKALRWQLLFFGTEARVPYNAAFWAASLGQYVNLIVPFMRLGEIARIYSLNREAHVNAAQTIGTLVVEKVLDLIFFGLTILLLVPYVVLPEQVAEPGPLVVAVPFVALIALYILAFQTERATRLLERIAAPLPTKISGWITRVGVAGLEGLSALRNRRLSLILLLLSLIIAVLSAFLPFLLFPALNMNLSLVDAALVHVVVSVVAAPPSTPVKIGVFNGAAAFVLWQIGVRDEAVIISYSILFYLVVIVPQLVLGIIASARSRWSWNLALETPVVGHT